MRRGRAAAAAGTAIAAFAIAVAPGGAGAGGSGDAGAAGKKKVAKVKVGDDFFAPNDFTVKKGTKVKWKWLSSNGNPHNVTFRKGPKKLKRKDKKKLRKLSLCTGSICDPVKVKLKKPGKYRFVCTIHVTTMDQTIKVKKGKKKG